MESKPLIELSAVLEQEIIGIDHVALAVLDLESAITFYTNLLGFKLVERRETHGTKSSMVSAVVEQGSLTFVLLQGINPESQVSQYITHYGPGVQHIAIAVKSLNQCVQRLKSAGFLFDTETIEDTDLKQIFSVRDANTGMMFEFIERAPGTAKAFSSKNVQQLFAQLEAQAVY